MTSGRHAAARAIWVWGIGAVRPGWREASAGEGLTEAVWSSVMDGLGRQRERRDKQFTPSAGWRETLNLAKNESAKRWVRSSQGQVDSDRQEWLASVDRMRD